MKIPTRLKVGAIWWEVKQVTADDLDSDRVTVADQNEFSQTIRLARELSPEMKGAAFIHEILHCIDNQMDHDMVELLANALYQVFSENELLAK